MVRKPPAYLKRLYVPLYVCHVYFFIEREAAIAFVKRRKVDMTPWADVTAGGVCSTDFEKNAVYIGAFDPESAPGVLAHEICHAAVLILDNLSIPVEGNNHEALTYLVQHLTDEFYTALRRHKAKTDGQNLS